MRRITILLFALASICTSHGYGQLLRGTATVQNGNGLQLSVATGNTRPALRVIVPDRSIEVLFPEHVTAVREGSTTAEHLYLSRPGQYEPTWRRLGQSIEYERDLPADIQMLARATLEDDGVRFRYELTNTSAVTYEMIYAVTDPRLTGIFRDERLERTYVHHQDGFDLLDSEIPCRITVPLDAWLPARAHASYTWSVPSERIETRADGITYHYKSRIIDVPFIATLSRDTSWVVTSFARDTGNVWSNPELTCQHVDPQSPLAPGQTAVLELKLLDIHGTLDDALERAISQFDSMKNGRI